MIGRNSRLISQGALGRVTGIKLTYPTGIQVEVGSVDQAKVLLQLSDNPQEANPSKEGHEELNPTYHFDNLHAPLHDRKTTVRNPLPYNAPYMRNRHRSMSHAQCCLININRLPEEQVKEYILSHNRKVCPQWVFSVPIKPVALQQTLLCCDVLLSAEVRALGASACTNLLLILQ